MLRPIFLIFLLFGAVLVADERIVLTVEDAVERALEVNRGLLSSAESLQSAQMQLGLQEGIFGLDWGPSGRCRMGDSGATFGAGVTFSRRLAWGTSMSCTPEWGRTANVSLSLTQPLFRGAGRHHNEAPIHAARHSVRCSERNWRLAQERVALRAIRALYTLAKQREILALEEANCEELARFAEVARRKAAVGGCSEVEVYKAELEWRRGEKSLTAAREREERAFDDLRQVLSLDAGVEVDLETPVVVDPVEVAVEVAQEEALERRVEIAQAEDELEESRRGIHLAKHKLLPELNLSCSYSHHNRGWGVGLTTGTTTGRRAERVAYTQSLMKADATRRALDQSREDVQREVKQAAGALQRAHERMVTGEANLHAATGKLRLAGLRRERGLASPRDFMEAQKGVRGAQADLVEAAVEHTLGYYQLLAATGLLL